MNTQVKYDICTSSNDELPEEEPLGTGVSSFKSLVTVDDDFLGEFVLSRVTLIVN